MPGKILKPAGIDPSTGKFLAEDGNFYAIEAIHGLGSRLQAMQNFLDSGRQNAPLQAQQMRESAEISAIPSLPLDSAILFSREKQCSIKVSIHLHVHDAKSEANVDLKICSSDHKSPQAWTPVATIGNHSKGSMVAQICADIPAGYYVKLSKRGVGIYAAHYLCGQKTII